ncbi:MAG: Membrane-bound lytic murein transglycosylase C [Gammaproteobacteria bacterium]|nr:Membrane-bound lytic murein transglycosylase C [Gammaproteobacteria bacterium]
MHYPKRYLACLVAGISWFWISAATGQDIFAYRAPDGSHLIADQPRIETGYHLVKVYSESNLWRQTDIRRRVTKKMESAGYDNLINAAARRAGVDPLLIKSVVHAESAFNPNAVSRKGASGLMQLMPDTAKRYGVSRIFDPHENVMGGAHYLSDLLNRFDGNLELALAGYNAGEQTVIERGGIPPYDETRRYVKRVMRLYDQYETDRCKQHFANTTVADSTVISCSASPRNPIVGNVGASSQNTLVSADERQWRLIDR